MRTVLIWWGSFFLVSTLIIVGVFVGLNFHFFPQPPTYTPPSDTVAMQENSRSNYAAPSTTFTQPGQTLYFVMKDAGGYDSIIISVDPYDPDLTYLFGFDTDPASECLSAGEIECLGKDVKRTVRSVCFTKDLYMSITLLSNATAPYTIAPEIRVQAQESCTGIYAEYFVPVLTFTLLGIFFFIVFLIGNVSFAVCLCGAKRVCRCCSCGSNSKVHY